MRKIYLSILAFCIMCLTSFANDITDIETAFKKYVNDANNYSENLPDYYIKYAKIIRIVNKKQGGQKEVIIPYDRYIKELRGHSALAKAVRYKNNYINIKIKKHGENYKLSATRVPRNDKKGLPCYFVYTKQNGAWKIKEESMTTNVQTFLIAK